MQCFFVCVISLKLLLSFVDMLKSHNSAHNEVTVHRLFHNFDGSLTCAALFGKLGLTVEPAKYTMQLSKHKSK